MRSFLRLIALLCALALCFGCFSALAEDDVYIGSRPAAGVYLTQTRRHTCTLIAATMMLRNYAYLRGSPYEMVDEWTVGFYAWSGGWGLAQHFVVGPIEVAQSSDIRRTRDKKQYLIDRLAEHPEGVVIYDTGAPHAIYLFGYDRERDIFYCADTVNSCGGRPIRLENSIIRGDDQEAKIGTIDKIWYVSGRLGVKT
ncbi:MAG: hypothetical protein IJI26_05770 [Clostridia bacterium]|nr:hypothetical protein [Clostridia bacterium]